ncbi:MAG: insulinase family protein [Proteobacteria bacterium]|nr:insulinase family protein [Pseudomonadota bacterium]
MNRHTRVVFALALAVSLAATAAGADKPASKASVGGELELPHQAHTLDNGLQVLLHEDHRLPLVAVSIWYHVGAFHEAPGRTGFAHLFEHMMFQGSAHVADDQHISLVQQIGGTGVNGTTSFDRTNYIETVPTHHLETVFWLESDRMGFLLPELTAEKLETQRQVVKNERRQSVETQPYGIAEERLWQALFPLPHSYYGRVIGSMQDLNAATLQDVRDFFVTWYAPSNATLVVAGDIEPRATLRLIRKYFGTLPARPRPKPPKVASVRLDREVVIEHEEEVGQLARVMVGWHSPAFFAPGDADADLLASLLSVGRSSRLQARLVHELQLAQSANASQESLGSQSVFSIEATARPGVKAERLLEEIDTILDSVRNGDLSQSEIKRAAARFETAFITDLQRLGGFRGRAEQLQRYNHFLGDPDYLARDLARYRNVSVQSLTDFVRKQLPKKRRAVLFARPKMHSAQPTQAEPGQAPSPPGDH